MFDLVTVLTHSVFHVLAALITLCSLLVVLSPHPVKSAVFLVVDLFLLAGLYASMDSHFVAAIQVLVYAGAIVVLFLFVIMLLNLQDDKLKSIRFSPVEAGTLMLTFVGFLIVIANILSGSPTGQGDQGMTTEAVANLGGNTYVVAMGLMTKYIWPFELASLLILLAIVASVVIAKKEPKQNMLADKSAGG